MSNENPKPRKIALNLTDNEVKSLTALAIQGGATVGTLLEYFITDLTYSNRSGGSDEENLARAWYDRRGFQYGNPRSFSAYLTDFDNARRFFDDLEDYENLIEERDYLTTHADEAKPDELEGIIEDAAIAREALEEYLSDYKRENPEATLEAIIADAKAHKAELTEHGRDVLESEPTEEAEDTRSAATIRKEASPDTVGTLERLEDEIYTAYGVDHKPAGLKWVLMALDLAKKITEEPGLLDTITEADLNQLTENNLHTARHAAETAQYLKKYII